MMDKCQFVDLEPSYSAVWETKLFQYPLQILEELDSKLIATYGGQIIWINLNFEGVLENFGLPIVMFLNEKDVLRITLDYGVCTRKC